MKKKTAYESRLADLATAWFRLASELDVYLQYEFTGATAVAGREDVLEAVDALVTQAIQVSGVAPEREARWLNLTVDRQPEKIRLIYSASGICQVDLAPLVKQGAEVAISQLSDIYELTAGWNIRPTSMNPAGGAPC